MLENSSYIELTTGLHLDVHCHWKRFFNYCIAVIVYRSMNECFHLEPESEINIVCPCFFGLLENRSAIVSFFHLTPKLCHWKFFTAYIMRFRAFSMGIQCLLASVPACTPQLLFKHSPVHQGGRAPNLVPSFLRSLVRFSVHPTCVPSGVHGLFLRAPTIFSGFLAFRMESCAPRTFKSVPVHKVAVSLCVL